MIFLKLQ